MIRLRLTKKPDIRTINWILQLLLISLGAIFLSGCNEQMTGVLNPKGIVTYEQRILLFDALALMLIVVIPVIIMSFAFVYKYREAHKQVTEYKPNWSHSFFLEGLWWGIPIIIVIILGVLSWRATHKLDPYHRINGDEVQLRVDVIALPWKWLFIYPDHNIATVNELTIPKGKQVELWLTGDNSAMAGFFVPQLASQIYTMAGMRTKLHIIATEEGTYRGLNSQYNGGGFSDNHFPVYVVDEQGMNEFLVKAKAASEKLSMSTYKSLREPSINAKPQYFAGVVPNLFQKVINYYLGTYDLEKNTEIKKLPHHAG